VGGLALFSIRVCGHHHRVPSLRVPPRHLHRPAPPHVRIAAIRRIALRNVRSSPRIFAPALVIETQKGRSSSPPARSFHVVSQVATFEPAFACGMQNIRHVPPPFGIPAILRWHPPSRYPPHARRAPLPN
jgi:hypothetical protein